MWSRIDEPPIVPPQYTRQPGRRKKKRTKNAAERDATGGINLPQNQRSLKCGHCGVVGHNQKTCHRHLPPKEKTSNQNRKRKLDASTSVTQTNTKRSGPLTKNEKRKKVELKAQNLKEKRDAKKEAAARGSQASPAKASTSSAPAPPKTIPSSSKQASPSK